MYCGILGLAHLSHTPFPLQPTHPTPPRTHHNTHTTPTKRTIPSITNTHDLCQHDHSCGNTRCLTCSRLTREGHIRSNRNGSFFPLPKGLNCLSTVGRSCMHLHAHYVASNIYCRSNCTHPTPMLCITKVQTMHHTHVPI